MVIILVQLQCTCIGFPDVDEFLKSSYCTSDARGVSDRSRNFAARATPLHPRRHFRSGAGEYCAGFGCKMRRADGGGRAVGLLRGAALVADRYSIVVSVTLTLRITMSLQPPLCRTL